MNPQKTSRPLVDVVEAYKEYVPPYNCSACIHELLMYVPAEYLRGLGRVVLTNASGLDQKRSSEPTTNPRIVLRRAGGVYHHGDSSGPAWIEIFIDNWLKHGPDLFDLVLAGMVGRAVWPAHVLYHELGHHIHRRYHFEVGDGEAIADRWSSTLSRRFIFRKGWPFIPAILVVLGFRAVWRFCAQPL